MHKVKSFLLILLSLLFVLASPSKVLADGLILPPDGPYPIYESSQEAAIFYQDGVENLVLSVKVNGMFSSEFGWIVPTPSKPEVDKVDASFFNALDEMTEPKQSLLDKIMDTGYGRYYAEDMTSTNSGKGATEDSSVSVIAQTQVGVLDITTLKSETVQDLLDWMEENGYKFPTIQSSYYEEEWKAYSSGVRYDDSTLDYYNPTYTTSYDELKMKSILQGYIEDDWYFALAKVDPEFVTVDESTGYYYGNTITNPVRLSFETTDIVYPMKISSLGLSGQSVLLTVFTDHKVRVSNYDQSYCGDVVPVLFAEKEDCSNFETIYAEKISKSEIYDLTRSVGKDSWLSPNKDMYLTRLYDSYLGYESMTDDVLFEDAENNKSVNAGEMSFTDWLILPFVFVLYLPYNILSGFDGIFGGYWGSSALVTVMGILAITGCSLLFMGLTLFGLSKIDQRKRFLRGLMRVILFPAVWMLAITLSLALVVAFFYLFQSFGINDEVLAVDSFLLEGMLSTLFTLLFYKNIPRILPKVA